MDGRSDEPTTTTEMRNGMHLNNNNNSLSPFSALSTGTGIKSAFGVEIIISVLNLHQAGGSQSGRRRLMARELNNEVSTRSFQGVCLGRVAV